MIAPPVPPPEENPNVEFPGSRGRWSLPRPTLPNPSEGFKSGKPGGVQPIHWPHLKLPRLLDADDTRMLARLLVYSLLVIWAAIVLAVAFGVAVRVFLMAKGG